MLSARQGNKYHLLTYVRYDAAGDRTTDLPHSGPMLRPLHHGGGELNNFCVVFTLNLTLLFYDEHPFYSFEVPNSHPARAGFPWKTDLELS